MASTLKFKRMQWFQEKSERPRLRREAGRAVDSRSELVAGKDRGLRQPPRITTAEQRVLALVVQARTNKEIALDLGISPATVKRHMEKILSKLGLRNRVEAAIYGLTLSGCPHESSSRCVFRKLQPGGDDTA